MPTEFCIGSSTTGQVSVVLVERSHPEARNYWDANWIATDITVAVRGFTAHVRASLRTDEIVRFRGQLKAVDRDLAGVAVLDSMENWISLRVSCGSRGQVAVEGQLQDVYADSGVTLSFELPDVDQSYLSGWIEQLENVVAAFPVVGRP